MRIAYLAAGAANMYCGSCLHDNTLAAALLKIGADIVLVPTYTPMRLDEPSVSQRQVLFGGINLYLQDWLPGYRHLPSFVHRTLDAHWVHKLVAKLDFSVDASRLGSLTVAMLEGERGAVKKEVFHLVDFLAEHIQPQIVHLTNALLMGLAPHVKRQLRVPVVCSLSGEDIFFEKLTPKYRDRVRVLMQERAAEIDRFVALNAYYADVMSDYLAIERSRISVIPHGLKLEGHTLRQPRTSPPSAESPLRIGYLARICRDKGLHQLVEAFKVLAADRTLPPLRLEAAGYLGASDRPYLSQIEQTIAAAGLARQFQYRGELTRDEKLAFLQSLDLFSVPTVYRESKGLSILEALANGVPVVQPRHGSFVEMIASTEGGLLFEPGDIPDLVAKLKQLILDPALAQRLGEHGHRAVQAQFDDRHMAEQTLEVYEEVEGAKRKAESGKRTKM